MSSLTLMSTQGGIPIRQTQLAPDGLEFSEDVSPAQWIKESLSGWSKVGSFMPDGFSEYARVLHPAYLDEAEEQPVRWAEVASWTGRTVHPQMQFTRIAGLSEDPHDDTYENPPWGIFPRCGSIPRQECRILMNTFREFTSTPGQCFFGLWEGYGNIDARLYKSNARVRVPARDHLLFRGPLDAVMSFVKERMDPFWSDSPNIWWPEDRAWCVTTDIDLLDTYVGGSKECIEAILSNSELEAFPTTMDARVDYDGDAVNAVDAP